MNVKGNRRVQMTKKLLKDSLLELLEMNKINQISICALCEQADVNRSTFYKYYGSQYELLQEIENEILLALETEIAQSENYSIHYTKMLDFIYENQNTIRLLLSEKSGTDFHSKLMQLPVGKQVTKMTLQNSKYTVAEMPYVSEALATCSFQIILHWLNTGCKETPQEIAKIAQKIMKNMLE